MVEYEVKKIESDNFVTMYDSDGFVTIQMYKADVLNIMELFDKYIRNTEKTTQNYKIEDSTLTLSLNVYDGLFTIEGRIKDVGNPVDSYFHDFILQDIDIEDWDDILDFLKNDIV